MHRVTIVDGFCPRPYDDRTLANSAMGGTEVATVLLAEALGRYPGYRVDVLQHCRRESYRSATGTTYREARCWRECASRSTADTVIVINSLKILGLWHRRLQKPANLIVWRHNFLGNHYRSTGRRLMECDATMVCVSKFQFNDSVNRMNNWPARISTHRVHEISNPVNVYREPMPATSRTYNRDKLVFCSSPHKGLDQVLSLFAEVRKVIPALELQVCNPGYLEDAVIKQPGVVSSGALDRRTLHRHIADALCVFYPQTEFAETFGLVAAEANALGTPIMAPAHLGAISQVVKNQDQLLENASVDGIVKLLQLWRKSGRPDVTANQALHPTVIVDEWCRLIRHLDADRQCGTRCLPGSTPASKMTPSPVPVRQPVPRHRELERA